MRKMDLIDGFLEEPVVVEPLSQLKMKDIAT